MLTRANFERLVSALDQWTSATEVAPGRIDVEIPDGPGRRSVTVIMTEVQWDDMVGPMWGSLDDAVHEVVRTLLEMEPRHTHALYEQYRLVPSTEPEWPARAPYAPEPGGAWFAYRRDGSRGDVAGAGEE